MILLLDMLKRIKSLWNGEAHNVTVAAFIIGGASVASRAVGLLRDRVLASHFGAGNELDAYYAAFRLPDAVYNLLILGALSAGFIPIFTEYRERRGKEAGWQLVGQVLSTVGAVLAVCCVSLAIIAPWLVPLVTPGFSQEKMQLTIQLTRIMLLSPFVMGLSGVLGGVLQSTRRFFAFSLAPVFYNLGIIFGALVLSNTFGVSGVAWGVIVGAILHFTVQALVVWPMGVGRLPLPSFSSEGVRRILKLMAPRTIGLAVSQMNLIFLMAFASYLSAGSVAVMNFANNLQSFPVGIIGISYAVAAFPLLASAASRKDREGFTRQFEGTARKILFLIIPMSAVFLLLRAQIVRLALGAGTFDWDDTIRTADILGIFALSLPAQALVALWARAFYAMQDSRIPLYASLISEAVNLCVAAATFRIYGVAGLAMAFTLSSWVNVCCLALVWAKRHADMMPKLILSTAKVVVAVAAFCIVAYPVRQLIGTWYPLRTYVQVAVQALAAGGSGILAFILVAAVLRIPEFGEVMRIVKRRGSRAMVPVAGAEEAQGM